MTDSNPENRAPPTLPLDARLSAERSSPRGAAPPLARGSAHGSPRDHASLKPQVLLVHGFPGNASDLEPLERALEALGTVALRPDLLGFGAAKGPGRFEDLWVDAQAARLAAMLHRPTVVFGHDLGVPTAVTLAALAPRQVSGLVLSSGNLVVDPPLAPPMRLLGVPALGNLIEAMLFSAPANRFMARDGTKRGDRLPAVNDADELRAIRVIFATALRRLPATFGPVQAHASALRCPVHFVWGDADPFFPVGHARRLQQLVPGSTLQVLEGVGHFPPLEATDAVAAAIRAMVDTVTRAPAPDEPT